MVEEEEDEAESEAVEKLSSSAGFELASVGDSKFCMVKKRKWRKDVIVRRARTRMKEK